VKKESNRWQAIIKARRIETQETPSKRQEGSRMGEQKIKAPDLFDVASAAAAAAAAAASLRWQNGTIPSGRPGPVSFYVQDL
jgi:hypothetical protein